jgi:hypothetical protein
MRVRGKLNQRTIYDVFHCVQQLGGIVSAIPLGKSKPIALSEQMAVKRDWFSPEGHSAILCARIDGQTLAPCPSRTMIERGTLVQK